MSCCLAWAALFLYTHSIKTVEYGLIIAFEVNMYYEVNLDGDTAILLIRGGDWRLIFNCKSNYMGQIASDVWLSVWLIKRPCKGSGLAGCRIQTKEKMKKVVLFVITHFKDELQSQTSPTRSEMVTMCADLHPCANMLFLHLQSTQNFFSFLMDVEWKCDPSDE